MMTKMVLVMLPVAREEGTPVVRPDGTSGVWPPSHTHPSYGYGIVWYGTILPPIPIFPRHSSLLNPTLALLALLLVLFAQGLGRLSKHSLKNLLMKYSLCRAALTPNILCRL